MRKAYKDQDWETFKLMLPDDNYSDDVVQVLLKGGGLQENFLLAVPRSFLVEKRNNILEQEKDNLPDLRKRIGIMLSHLLARMPEIKSLDTDQKTDLAEPLVDTIYSNLVNAINLSQDSSGDEEEAEQIQAKMTEMIGSKKFSMNSS